jgi:hypothetical protein
LSGIGAVVIEGEVLKAEGIQNRLCQLAQCLLSSLNSTDRPGNEVYSNAAESPVWVQYGSDGQDFQVVRDRTEDSQVDLSRIEVIC